MITVNTVTVLRGDTWARAWVLESPEGVVLDLTGCTIRLHVRDWATDVKVAEASLVDGRLTVNIGLGRIDMVIPASVMVLTPGKYRFDLEVTTTATGQVRTYESGMLVVVKDATYG